MDAKVNHDLWVVGLDGGEGTVITADDGALAIARWLAGSALEPHLATYAVTVYAYPVLLCGSQDGRREPAEDWVAVEPTEPPCWPGGSHVWARPVDLVGGPASDPGVTAKGDGLIEDDACMICGMRCRTDSSVCPPSTEYTPDVYSLPAP